VKRSGNSEQKLRRNFLRTSGVICVILDFANPNSKAKLSALDEPRPSGFDAVELLFSPNPGEPLKPLRAIASSGEISRLMLAIKSALAAHDENSPCSCSMRLIPMWGRNRPRSWCQDANDPGPVHRALW